jgi:hypothetical protein
MWYLRDLEPAVDGLLSIQNQISLIPKRCYPSFDPIASARSSLSSFDLSPTTTFIALSTHESQFYKRIILLGKFTLHILFKGPPKSSAPMNRYHLSNGPSQKMSGK